MEFVHYLQHAVPQLEIVNVISGLTIIATKSHCWVTGFAYHKS